MSKAPPKRRNDRQSTLQWLLWPALIATFLLVLLISSIPLTVEQQLLFVLTSLGLSLLLRPSNELARYRVIVLISVSIIATGRYIYWRLTDSLEWFNSNIDLTPLDYLFSAFLLLAEIYAWVVLFLGYFQTIWPLRRPVCPLPGERALWPSVDILIPTYNEPLKVVAPSLLAAARLDWPTDRLNVYLLDDGCREEFRDFAEEIGVHYIERHSSEGAKAGNINHALARTFGDYVAIFDCDHVPVRSFLRKTMGWFLRDPKLGIVQTPHLFYTPDPVERNLQVYHRVPPEGQLFYGLVQDGNDTWNASFFCGSCAVLKREALDEIGGIATDTVTEDAHTSLLVQKKGWNTAYLNEPLAAGLATEKLSHHIGQRMRWARGMVQVFRIDNPLIARGLSLGQRLCYFNAMLHFLFGLPRLIFLTAPLAYLFFEAYVIQASAAAIAVYALPHIFQAQVANSVMQGRYRHSFWADVYETLISAHLIGPTLGPLINPSKGHFNVTDKGGTVKQDHFDFRSAKVVFFLLLLNLIGLFVAFLRLFWLNPDETGTVLINLGWTVYNSIILGAALSVAWEKRQRRDNPRIQREFRALLHLPDGRRVDAVSKDLALTDISLRVPGGLDLRRDDEVIVELFDGDIGYRFPGKAKTVAGAHLGVLFDSLSPSQMSDLVYFTHARDDSWEPWYRVWSPSKPLASFFEIVRFGVLGVFRALGGHSDDPENRVRPGFSTAVWLAVVALLVVSSYLAPRIARAEPSTDAATLHLTFEDLGLTEPLRLRGGNTQDAVWFALRADQVAKRAELRLTLTLARQLQKDYRALEIALNGQGVGEIEINDNTVERELHEAFAIDPLYISDLNQLSFRLDPIEPQHCEKLDLRAVTAKISKKSDLFIELHPLDLVNDLAAFPIPFYDRNDNHPLTLPFILNQRLTRSREALKAAGVLASWFGGKADYRAIEFPVLINSAPRRHAVVLATPDTHYDFLPNLKINGPGVEMRSLPVKGREYIKLLVIKGRNDHELMAAATTLVSGQAALAGDKVDFDKT
ncbi:MAG TPA: UDP-forming cellulose synthase catalytic subunit, partial [Gammaproteobacteria bacterium]|nr:UDP-forming cellulose synthase catalytic subunit [Gammaproteobacteria bacterium]